MRPETRDFISKCVNKKLIGKLILEVGSLDVNGTITDLLPKESSYFGIDMREGSNVNKVMNSHLIECGNEEFDTVLCLDMLEHDADPFKTIKEITRVLKINGTFVLVVPSFMFPLHEHPSDYWRFSFSAVYDILMKDFKVLEIYETNMGIFAIGRKQ